ncbi:stage II sporulation protein D [Paenactinomyces guangxiensis]|uniref:Stage II sporulation protein D n=1 Tax=Paenactinomyces guangxiensis TaxID=1490290 RepID=A0A7W2AA75_9BACL|nr:stage II sporulation protein D [Paenactinomyces guangxiensis]MBA4495977.1 stage II sporulation protein D [Paenactinomyces guangxiensis]MBH8593036.1 stage II sporulation protein D [Paenactinomyces guangxiensis]
MQKRLLFLTVTLIIVILIIPALLVAFQTDPSPQSASASTVRQVNSTANKDSSPVIRVYLTHEKRVEEVPLESYIRGVVASEMPVNFHVEALKAQALAARTYIIDRLVKKDFSDMSRWGKAAESAVVTDTVQHQVYSTDQQLQKKWGTNYKNNIKKIDEAVRATRGKIITYKGKPIYAAFFSTSNGRTENSEDYFSAKYPYLRSVDSSWDQQSPKYEGVKTLRLDDLTRKLQKKTGKSIALPTSSGQRMMQVLERTSGNRISRIQIGDQKFTGREVREALQLPSSDFSWEIKGKKVVVKTRGYGHGVGMSQWGANLMAQQGKKVTEIVQHYYQGVKVQKVQLTISERG